MSEFIATGDDLDDETSQDVRAAAAEIWEFIIEQNIDGNVATSAVYHIFKCCLQQAGQDAMIEEYDEVTAKWSKLLGKAGLS